MPCGSGDVSWDDDAVEMELLGDRNESRDCELEARTTDSSDGVPQNVSHPRGRCTSVRRRLDATSMNDAQVRRSPSVSVEPTAKNCCEHSEYLLYLEGGPSIFQGKCEAYSTQVEPSAPALEFDK